jgi:Domain of unknown function (DUF4190)
VTNPPEQPFHGVEYPSLENTPKPPDPYAPVDYPPTYPPPLPPPVYPQLPPPGAYPGAYPGYPSGYPGYSADPYDPYRAGRPIGTNGKATAALVTALVGLFFCGLPSIAGLILGIIAMRECKQTGQDGYGIALAGTIIGGLVVAAWILYVIFVFAFAAQFNPYSTV